MPRKPIAVPVRFLGASSLTKAGVDEVTIAKPNPYTVDRERRAENWVENGTLRIPTWGWSVTIVGINSI